MRAEQSPILNPLQVCPACRFLRFCRFLTLGPIPLPVVGGGQIPRIELSSSCQGLKLRIIGDFALRFLASGVGGSRDDPFLGLYDLRSVLFRCLRLHFGLLLLLPLMKSP